MPTEFLIHGDDPRLAPYRNLKQSRRERDPQWVIAEGRIVVQRLLESDLHVQSVLLSERRHPLIRHEIPDEIETLVLPDDRIDELLGFRFHSGVIGCGIRPVRLETPLPDSEADRQVLIACPYTVLPENLGGIIRLAAGFGAMGLLIGHQSVDPFLRRVVRVSMGTVFQLPICISSDLIEETRRLKQERGFEVIATTLNADARPLREFRPAARSLVLLGNEADGLDDHWSEVADHQLTVPMSGAVDSLNVATAAAVFLYHFLGETTMNG